MDPFSTDAVVLVALMLVGVFSIRQLIEEDLRAGRARRWALKALARRLGGVHEVISRSSCAGERVHFERHGLRFVVFYDVVIVVDDPSCFTRVERLKDDGAGSFPSATVVPEDFLERADNLLFGREDRHLDARDLDEQVLVRAEAGPSLDTLRSRPVLEALRAFLAVGAWRDSFMLESLPGMLRISLAYHLEEPARLEEFATAGADLLAAFPTVPAGSIAS